MTIREWLTVVKEPVEAIVFGKAQDWNYGDEPPAHLAPLLEYPISLADAEPFLDIAFHDGFGGAESVPFYLWTATRVYFVGEYDGSEWLTSVPRHPQPCWPRHSGGLA